MKRLFSALTLLLLSQIATGHAAVTIDVKQIGSDVVATAKGTLNVSDLGTAYATTPFDSFVLGLNGTSVVGAGARPDSGVLTRYLTLSPSLAFVLDGSPFVEADLSTGTMVEIRSQVGQQTYVSVPEGYQSGDAIDSTSTWQGATIADLGLIPGIYVFSWGSGENADSLTVNIESPQALELYIYQTTEQFEWANNGTPISRLDGTSDDNRFTTGSGVVADATISAPLPAYSGAGVLNSVIFDVSDDGSDLVGMALSTTEAPGFPASFEGTADLPVLASYVSGDFSVIGNLVPAEYILPALSANWDGPVRVTVAENYVRQQFGFDGCSVQFDGDIVEGVTLQEMIELAEAANLEAFAYNPFLRFGRLFQNPFPDDCQSDASLSWPLFIDPNWIADNTQFSVAASVAAGNGAVNCDPTSVPPGGSSTCTAVPDAGWQVSGWTGACAAAGTSATCTLDNIQADQTSTVSFEAIPLSVVATVASGNGSVSCDPTSVSPGGSSTCTAVPDSGWQVSGWTGACAAAGTSATCTLDNIQADQTSTVGFEAIPLTIVATVAAGNGTVSCDPASVAPSGSSTCIAVPDVGWQVSGWTGACAAAGTSETCTLDNIQADQTSGVTFEIASAVPVEVTPVPTLSRLGLIILGLFMVLTVAIRYRW